MVLYFSFFIVGKKFSSFYSLWWNWSCFCDLGANGIFSKCHAVVLLMETPGVSRKKFSVMKVFVLGNFLKDSAGFCEILRKNEKYGSKDFEFSPQIIIINFNYTKMFPKIFIIDWSSPKFSIKFELIKIQFFSSSTSAIKNHLQTKWNWKTSIICYLWQWSLKIC